ncbi:phage tail tape measure protein [Edwardsiella tarda]|uniref:phage tail tape measure protein n=1 Tax=Edwardsiella tarda TaxID=636 RepID=UPI002444D995|nr:phage tail tape measure protein [Edwardsiella tarda]WGE29414.1 phage tail tape measure protein [Edwardsiella tarda]
MAAQLDFTLSLVDKLTRPLKQAQQAVTGFTDQAGASITHLAMGTAGLLAVGVGLKSLVDPARQMERALGEVASLDVADKTLDELRQTAQAFAVDFGESATDFVKSAYNIQSAIAGLRGNELANFTQASAILAKATKSDAATITSYMGTMYGIFNKTADKMGRTRWVQQIAGQTALAVKMFKTTGNDMSAAMTTLGASAEKMNISAAEQFAILGQLQGTMSGAEAGTKYRSFLDNIGSAQKTLGLNFTNQNGTTKNIVDILTLIRGKFGDLSRVADADLLKKAFGKEEAVSMIKLLVGNIGVLKKNIDTFSHVTGMRDAITMAKKMVDPWDRVAALLEQIRVTIALRLEPAFAPLLTQVIATGRAFLDWLNVFPNLARWVGYLSGSMLTLTAIGAVNNVVMGVFRFIASGLIPIITALAWAFNIKARYLSLSTLAVKYYERAMLKLRPALVGASMLFRTLGLSELLALWPVLAIAAAIAALVIVVIKFWQPIKAFFNGFIQGFHDAHVSLAPLKAAFSPLILAFGLLWRGVRLLFGAFSDLLSPIQFSSGELQSATHAGVSFGRIVAEVIGWVLSPITLVSKLFGRLATIIHDVSIIAGHIWDNFDATDISGSLARIKKLFSTTFSNLWVDIKNQFIGTFNDIVGMLNKLPGINISLMSLAPTSSPSLITGGHRSAVPGGPITHQISNSQSDRSLHQTNNNTITLHVDTLPHPGQLAEYAELAAG